LPTLNGINNVFTFTLQSLLHESKEHLSAEITEMRRLVRVNVKVVRPYLQLFRSSFSWSIITFSYLKTVTDIRKKASLVHWCCFRTAGTKRNAHIGKNAS